MKTRIWTYWNRSPVKITISDKKPTRLHKCEPTDEGFHSEEEEYTLVDGVVFRECSSYSVDCDGPFETNSVCSWKIGGETVPLISWTWDGLEYELPEHRPDWKRVSASQRDHFAEAMGY